MPVRSPGKPFIFIIWSNRFWIKLSKKNAIWFWKQTHWLWPCKCHFYNENVYFSGRRNQYFGWNKVAVVQGTAGDDEGDIHADAVVDFIHSQNALGASTALDILQSLLVPPAIVLKVRTRQWFRFSKSNYMFLRYFDSINTNVFTLRFWLMGIDTHESIHSQNALGASTALDILQSLLVPPAIVLKVHTPVISLSNSSDLFLRYFDSINTNDFTITFIDNVNKSFSGWANRYISANKEALLAMLMSLLTMQVCSEVFFKIK